MFQSKIVESIYKAGKHGINAERLFDKLYGNDIDGGPDSGFRSMYVSICYINKKLRIHKKRIISKHAASRHGEHGRYFLEDVA